MKLLDITDLWHMTKIELTLLEHKLSLGLSKLPEGSPERTITLLNLHTIRHVLMRDQPTLQP